MYLLCFLISERRPQGRALCAQLLPVWAWRPGHEAEPVVLQSLQSTVGSSVQSLHAQSGKRKYICPKININSKTKLLFLRQNVSEKVGAGAFHDASEVAERHFQICISI